MQDASAPIFTTSPFMVLKIFDACANTHISSMIWLKKVANPVLAKVSILIGRVHVDRNFHNTRPSLKPKM